MTEYKLKIHPIPTLQDNYVWAIIDEKLKLAVVVDPGEAAPVIDYLSQNNLNLSAILITHHHWDHTGGIDELKQAFDVPVYGPAESGIDSITNKVRENNQINLQPLHLILEVIEIPGHTLDHIAYYSPGMLFCGDTLFSAGCGRVFEGTGQQMYNTLQKLSNLPEKTKIYCAHEYTLKNLQFAQTVEPSNQYIKKYMETIEETINHKQPSLPSTLQIEKETNPFLRCTSPPVIAAVEKHTKKSLSSGPEVFIQLRKWKDTF